MFCYRQYNRKKKPTKKSSQTKTKKYQKVGFLIVSLQIDYIKILGRVLRKFNFVVCWYVVGSLDLSELVWSWQLLLTTLRDSEVLFLSPAPPPPNQQPNLCRRSAQGWRWWKFSKEDIDKNYYELRITKTYYFDIWKHTKATIRMHHCFSKGAYMWRLKHFSSRAWQSLGLVWQEQELDIASININRP